MPVVFTGYNQIRYIQPVEGEIVFTSNGSFLVPNGVSSISIVAVGGGGAGAGIAVSTERSGPGGGGALAYVNDVSVTSGEILTVVVGQRGLANNNAGKPGGNSYVRRGNTDLIHAGGGMGGFWVVNNTITIGTANGGTVVVGTGGAGGRGPGAQGGGGGAGGYAGSGGNGRSGSGTGGAPETGSGGGAGGGRPGLTDGGDGGGGVGIYGLGADGVPSDGTTPSTGGSGGGSSQGIGTNDFGGYGGDYGGGGGTVEEATAPQPGGNGGNGVVRIIWSDSRPRQFPSTNVDGTRVYNPTLYDYESIYGTPPYTITTFPSTGSSPSSNTFDVLIAIDANISPTDDGVLIEMGGNTGSGLAIGVNNNILRARAFAATGDDWNTNSSAAYLEVDISAYTGAFATYYMSVDASAGTIKLYVQPGGKNSMIEKILLGTDANDLGTAQSYGFNGKGYGTIGGSQIADLGAAYEVNFTGTINQIRYWAESASYDFSGF